MIGDNNDITLLGFLNIYVLCILVKENWIIARIILSNLV